MAGGHTPILSPAHRPAMRFHVLTLFPKMFEAPLGESIMGRAIRQGVITVQVHNIRDFTHDRHRTVDDYPYSGGPGMVMKPEPLFEAVETLRASGALGESAEVILLTPQGRTFTQRVAEELAGRDEMALICGRYEGVDERVRQHLATDEISIGDYVLGGGELAAMVLMEAMVPGVVGSAEDRKRRSRGCSRCGAIQKVGCTGYRPPRRGLRWHESLRRTFERTTGAPWPT